MPAKKAAPKVPGAKKSEKLFGKGRAKGTVELDGAPEYREKLWKHVLQNAVFHGGNADCRAVFGRAMAAEPELRTDPAGVQEAVAELVVEVNGLGLEKQKAALEALAPELLVKEEKPTGLPELPGAKEGGVVTRFAPAPTGALHIGHIVRAAMLSALYAKRYHGTFILRIEDTDAKKLKPEFYEYIPADLRAVGIAWDQFAVESDFMDAYSDVAGKLLADGKLYVCLCPAASFSQLKQAGKDCPCRKHIAEENV
ncbi:MAG TPA: glutamate--tRNA ligase family protein, partial [archaeon]|nr:glutamate--tRNA ligase family protein [archaeon]